MPSADVLLEKIPPQSLEAEQALLGGMLIDISTAWPLLDGFHLREEEFYRESHRMIYRAICELLTKRQPVDLILLGEWLKAHDQLEAIGGMLYLTTIMGQCPTAAGSRKYAEVVREHAMRRRMIHIGSALIERAYRADEELQNILLEHEAEVDAIKHGNAAALRKLRQLWEWEIAEVQRMEEEHELGEASGILSGIPGYDELLDPMRPGDIHLIVGRPSMGKTLLAQSLATNNAAQGRHVLFLSLEMSEAALADRILIAESENLSNWELKRYAHRKAEWNQRIYCQIEREIQRHQEWDFALEKPAVLTPEDVRDYGKRKQREGGLDLLLIDYIGLMDCGERKRKKGDDRYAEMGYISRQLKLIAGELRVPIVALCQINRQCEARADKRPMLSDLRDSGNLEQDADIVTAVFREGYYDKRIPATNGELIVLKQRNGRVGTRPVYIGLDRSLVCGVADEDSGGYTDR